MKANKRKERNKSEVATESDYSVVLAQLQHRKTWGGKVAQRNDEFPRGERGGER